MTRHDLPKLLNKGIGVEIGVETGKYSEIILGNSNLDVLYSIDSWTSFNEEDYIDINNLTQSKHDENKAQTELRLKRFGDRSVVIKSTSEEASKDFADNSLDFVYIDANHSYEGCKRDIELWWPKLKQGGIFAGHDFIPDGNYQQGLFGVEKAVREFEKELNIRINFTDEIWKTWYTIKGQQKKEKNLVLTIAIGDYVNLGQSTHPTIKTYADRIDADFLVISEQSISTTTPHWEKFQISSLLDRYERIFYVDTDVIIRDDCPNVFDIVPDDSLGIFNEAQFTDRSKELMIDICKQYGVVLPDWNGAYYNTGVMVISQCHKDMFTKPEQEIFSFYEQGYINMVIARDTIKVHGLKYHFNRMTCMDSIIGEERYVSYVIHYAGAPVDTNTLIDVVNSDIKKWDTKDYTDKKHIIVLVGGGLGDQVCAEPVLRFLKKEVYPNDDVVITSHWPRLFRHLDMPVYESGTFYPRSDTPYRILQTLPEPDNPEGALMWNVVSHLLCHPVDFMSMAALRRTLPIKDREYKLYVSEEDTESVSKRFGKLDDLVLVHAGLHWESKTFPLEYWQAIVDGLISRGLRVGLIGQAGSSNLDNRGFVPIIATEGCVDMRNELSLGELIAVISKAKTLISNDSAPIHIAGAFDNNIVLIPTCKHPDHILPWRKGSIYHKAVALYKCLTIDDVPSDPTQVYEVSGDRIKQDWSVYLPEINDVIETVWRYQDLS